MSPSQLQNKILKQFNMKISVSSLNNFRASVSLTGVLTSKEPELMGKLNKSLCILNAMGICDLAGRSIQFDV